jgi:S1-C subfamily serine protease
MPGDFDFDTDDPKPAPKRSRSRDDERDRRDEPRSRQRARDDDDDDDEDDEAPRSKPAPRKTYSDNNPFANEAEPEPVPAPARRRNDDDEERVDRRSRKRRSEREEERPSRYGQQAKKGSPMLIIGVAVIGLVVAGIVTTIIILASGDKKEPTKEVAKEKDKNTVVVSKDKPADKKDDTGNSLLTKDVVDKVKRNTVYVRVLFNNGKGGTGSGFVDRETKRIITNAHVVGLLDPKDKGPKLINLVFNSGEKNEFMMGGEIYSFDQESDLAAIEPRRDPTQGVTLPEGLTVANQRTKIDLLQDVIVFGYPLGESLGKEITIAPTNITRIGKNPRSGRQEIQVKGAMTHGNSGGPVVDKKGNVVGVAVAGYEKTDINLAIHFDVVQLFLKKPGLDDEGEPMPVPKKMEPKKADPKKMEPKKKETPKTKGK